MTLRNIPDVDRMKAFIDGGVKHVVVVGGGFIGLEVAEQLIHRNVRVTMIELTPQVMAPFDPEMCSVAQQTLIEHGVDLRLGTAVKTLKTDGTKVSVVLDSGSPVSADLVLLAIGVAPESRLARDCGLAINDRGAIKVDASMRTNDPHIYAVGDAVEVADAMMPGGRVVVPLAGPANRQGRLAADHIFREQAGLSGGHLEYRGTQGTGVVRVFGLVLASSGWNEKRLKAAGKRLHQDYEVVYIHPFHHASYYPGAKRMHLKLLFARPDGKILGVQVFGEEGVEKRVDVIAMAMQMGGTVFDLAQAELSYAPPFGSAKDPVNMVGFQGANILQNLTRVVTPSEVRDAGQQWTILDVRTRNEFTSGHLPNAVNIPLNELRERLAEVPRGKPVIAYCAVGLRGYLAQRLLSQSGIDDVRNMTGGYTSWSFLTT
jgi:NADPH-dependent 2,4-dienoyl-CoA reductase/sulfur reductase-like enzyme/rhodanese-related sulfurtransferase